MNKIKKTFKYRIYPTKEQAILLAKHFGAKRFVWNYFLNERKNAYLENNNAFKYRYIIRKQSEIFLKKKKNFVNFLV